MLFLTVCTFMKFEFFQIYSADWRQHSTFWTWLLILLSTAFHSASIHWRTISEVGHLLKITHVANSWNWFMICRKLAPTSVWLLSFVTLPFNILPIDANWCQLCCRTWNSQSQISLTNELLLSIHCHLLLQSRKSTVDPQFISNTCQHFGKNFIHSHSYNDSVSMKFSFSYVKPIIKTQIIRHPKTKLDLKVMRQILFQNFPVSNTQMNLAPIVFHIFIFICICSCRFININNEWVEISKSLVVSNPTSYSNHDKTKQRAIAETILPNHFNWQGISIRWNDVHCRNP
jgi:hypothetical protein